LRGGLVRAGREFDLDVFSDVDVGDAPVAHLFQRALDGFALGIHHGFLWCNDNFCFHLCSENFGIGGGNFAEGTSFKRVIFGAAQSCQRVRARTQCQRVNAQRILVIGGGIVGLASAFKLGRRFPGARVTVLEKEARVARHQTGNNSGVLHCGLYYRPGSLKARLAVQGIQEMAAFCRDSGVPHEICGELVVAVDEAEVPRLKQLHERGRQNGLQGLKWLSREEMREIEPHAAGVAGLRVPQEGIVDYPKVCEVLLQKISAQGGTVVTRAKVTQLRQNGSGWVVGTTAGDFETNFLVNCAGLHCDRVSELAGERRDVRIVPFRGEYYKLKPGRQHLVKHLIYPVPDPEFPFLGVHFTRLIHGGIEAGPNAVLALAREGYRKTDFNAADFFDALSFAGLWKFLGRHKRICWVEWKRSFSKKLFCASLQRLVPEVQMEDLETGGAGVRAQAMSPDGTLVQDFSFVRGRNALHVLNAPSPAATASLAIGEEIARQIE
jgi:(S)-2-hydroxyglutarate dehydrogenase